MVARMKLYYFTNSYPFGMSMLWKPHELEVFKKYCKEITVIPFSFWGNSEAKNVLEGIHYRQPLFPEQPYVSIRQRLFTVLFSRHIGLFAKQFFSHRVFLNKAKFISWILDSYTIHLLTKHPVIKELLAAADEDTIWYFYWARHSSLIIPLLKKKNVKICCRFHGYDLYEERNKGRYVGYQDEQVKAADLLMPCSQHGSDYLAKKYPSVRDKIFIARLGSQFKAVSGINNNGVLRIVSCATVRPVKRLHLLAQALQYVKSQVMWVHIGGGPDYEQLKQQAEAINRPNVQVSFTGNMPGSEIIDFYVQSRFDLFVNVSESEGVPVSVMEAFSAGIPVYATNVGGTGEIVDESVGKLLPPDLSPQFLAQCLDEFAALPLEKKEIFRNNAIQRFRDRCDAARNAELLIQEIEQRLLPAEPVQ